MSLERPSGEILKWYGYELSVSTNTKDHSLNGKYSTDQLQTMIQSYISEFVLCDTCGNPETKYVTSKNRVDIIGKKCAACAATNSLRCSEKMKKAIIQFRGKSRKK